MNHKSEIPSFCISLKWKDLKDNEILHLLEYSDETHDLKLMILQSSLRQDRYEAVKAMT